MTARTPRDARVRWTAGVVVALATLAGGAARVGTAEWGLPHAYHVDEKGFVVWEALSTEWRGLVEDDYRPRMTTYGPLVLAGVIATKWATTGGPGAAREEALRHASDWRYVQDAFGHDAGKPFQLPELLRHLRLVSASLATLAILLLALAAWRLGGPGAGAVTAVLCAASVGLIQVGHFYTAEALLVVELAAFLHACALLARGGGMGAALYAGLALGAIAATKMPGLLAIGALPAAISADDELARALDRAEAPRRALRRLLWACLRPRALLALAVAVGVYGAACPWALTEPALYFGEPLPNRSGLGVLLSQYTERSYGFYDWRFTYNGTTPFLYQATHVLPYALGAPLVVASLYALVRGALRLSPAERIVLLAAVPTLLLVGTWGVKTIRYVVPALPPLILGAGLLLSAWAGARPVGAPWHRHLVRRALAFVVCGATLAYGAAFASMFASTDPRTRAAEHVLAHARAGDVVVVGPEASYTAPLADDAAMVGAVTGAREAGLILRTLFGDRPSGRPQLAAHLDTTLDDARFLVVDEFYLRRGVHPEAPRLAPDHHAFYRALLAGETGFVRVAAWRPEPAIGPLRWDERDDEILAVCFDHPPMQVWERRGAFRNPLR